MTDRLLFKKVKAKKYKEPRIKKPKFDKSKYEGYQYGPLTVERYGREVLISSNWNPDDHKEFIKNLKTNRDTFKNEISSKIQELTTVARENNIIELLSALAPQHVFADPETFTESGSKVKEYYLEYALSIALSIKNPDLSKHASKEAIEKFRTLIAEVHNDTFWYFATGDLDEEETKREIRQKALLHHLFVRGDSYEQHHIDLLKGLFENHDKFFIKNYGFNTNDVINRLNLIEEQIVNSLHKFARFSQKIHDTHNHFIQFMDKRGGNSFSTIQEAIIEFDALPDMQGRREELTNLGENIDEFIFEINPTTELPKSFLDLISATFGDNESFATFKKGGSWVTNDSIIYRNPIIRNNERYFCFSIQILYRNIIFILESLIKEKDKNYFDEEFQKSRANFLEQKTLEYLGNLLPDAKIYPNLYYWHNGARFETDGLIIFDTNIFIIEAKSNAFTLPARRGALKRIERDVKYIVEDAYNQALRTKRYINKTEIPEFEFKNGKKAFVLNKKSQYKNIYLINVTLENLGPLSNDLTSLKKLDLLKGKEWIWSVFLNDLRVISEITDSPSEFLVYLHRRLRINDFPQFEAKDELDYFMFYLNEGLYFEDAKFDPRGTFSPHGYTEKLDRYYHYKLGLVSSGEKPTLKIPEDYKQLIRRIEATKKLGFSEVTTTFLGFDLFTMEEILKYLQHTKEISLNDAANDHDFTLLFGTSMGLTVAVFSKEKGRSIESTSEYCKVKMYQTKIPKWIFLAVDIRDGEEKYYFFVFNEEWKYDPTKEKEVELFNSNKLKKYFSQNKKPKPNDPCPCNSGRKFKKCHSHVFN